MSSLLFNQDKVNVCLVFYGIGRGVELTSIAYRDLMVNLNKLNIPFESFYFYNKTTSISNPRSSEFGDITEPPSYCFNETERFAFVPSDIYDFELYEFSKKFRDCHNDDYKSNSNLIHQLLLLHQVQYKIDLSKYTHMMLLRDDTVVDFQLTHALAYIDKCHSLIFSKWGIQNGLNDRFIFGPIDLVVPLLSRYNYAKTQILSSGYFNGEELLWYVVRKLNLSFIMLDIKISRVRLGNRIHPETFALPKRPGDLFKYILNFFKLLLIR